MGATTPRQTIDRVPGTGTVCPARSVQWMRRMRRHLGSRALQCWKRIVLGVTLHIAHAEDGFRQLFKFVHVVLFGLRGTRSIIHVFEVSDTKIVNFLGEILTVPG